VPAEVIVQPKQSSPLTTVATWAIIVIFAYGAVAFFRIGLRTLRTRQFAHPGGRTYVGREAVLISILQFFFAALTALGAAIGVIGMLFY
jgi:hypothetical protein